MVKITANLRNAKLTKQGDFEFLTGEIFGDTEDRFPDGYRVHTSYITKLIDVDVFETRSQSVYRVENWEGDGRAVV